MLGEKHILITLLGGASRQGYKPADYAFSANDVYSEKYFGLALAAHLRKTGRHANKMVVIGTKGSFWDNLVKLVLKEADAVQLIDLTEKCVSNVVTEADLEQWKPALLTRLYETYGVSEIDLIINDYARESRHQIRLISAIARMLEDGTRITFDITHAFRHLSMLSLLSAIILHRTKHIPIEVYYGAFEAKGSDGKTPVLALDGLMRIVDWLAALSSYDKDGDYAVFAPLIEPWPGGKTKATLLREAAFHESIGNFEAAAQNLRDYMSVPLQRDDNSPMTIFAPMLEERFAWVGEEGLYKRQRRQAFDALKRGDFFRAAIWGVEAVITRLAVRMEKPPELKQVRDTIGSGTDWLQAFRDAGLRTVPWEFYLLKELRNRFAHAFGAGNEGHERAAKEAMQDRETCARRLQECFAELLPETP